MCCDCPFSQKIKEIKRVEEGILQCMFGGRGGQNMIKVGRQYKQVVFIKQGVKNPLLFTLIVNYQKKLKTFLFKTNQSIHITLEAINCSSYLIYNVATFIMQESPYYQKIISNNFISLPVPCISESSLEIKIKLNFYFQFSLWCLRGK